MGTSKNARDVYFGINEKWVVDKFTPKEISLFFKEGKSFFEKYLIMGPNADDYLEDHPEFAEVLKKW